MKTIINVYTVPFCNIIFNKIHFINFLVCSWNFTYLFNIFKRYSSLFFRIFFPVR